MDAEQRSPYVWMRGVLGRRDLEEVQELAFACPHHSDWLNYPQAAGRAVGRSIELTLDTVTEQMETVRRRFPRMFNEWTRPYRYEASGNRCLREQAGDDTSKIPYAVHSDGEQRHLVAILYIGQWEGGATRIGSEKEHEEFLRVKGPEQLMGGGEISGIAPRGFEPQGSPHFPIPNNFRNLLIRGYSATFWTDNCSCGCVTESRNRSVQAGCPCESPLFQARK